MKINKEWSSLVLFNQIPHYDFLKVIIENYTKKIFKWQEDFANNFNPDLYKQLEQLWIIEGIPIFHIQTQIFSKLVNVNSEISKSINFLIWENQTQELIEEFIKNQEIWNEDNLYLEKSRIKYWLLISSTLNLGNSDLQNIQENMYRYNIESIYGYITNNSTNNEILKFNIKLFISIYLSKYHSFQFVHNNIFAFSNLYNNEQDINKNNEDKNKNGQKYCILIITGIPFVIFPQNFR